MKIELNSPNVHAIFAPKPNITTFELATVLKTISLGFGKEIYDGLSPEIKRHFNIGEHET